MNIVGIGLRNAWRNRVRALLTIVGVGVAVLAFLFLRTILSAWTVGVDYASKDRIATRHRVTFVLPLPVRYADQIRQIPGIVESSYALWFGARNPKEERKFFASMAVESKTFFKVFDEVTLTETERQNWMQDRRGAIVGDVLAKQFGWKVGDRVTLQGTIYPGDWEFIIDGIYGAKRRSIDRSSLFFHWDYLNESVTGRQKNNIGWVASRISDPAQAGAIANKIDAFFDQQDTQTLSMSERAMNTSFLGMLGAVLKAMDIVSVVILLIMGLILGNTIAMGVRERTHEYGVLRAIGFLPHHLAAFILGEAAVIGILGAVVGISVAFPIINQGMGRFLEENMGSFFPYVRVNTGDVALSAGLAIALSMGVALIPAYQASKLKPIDALRRVG